MFCCATCACLFAGEHADGHAHACRAPVPRVYSHEGHAQGFSCFLSLLALSLHYTRGSSGCTRRRTHTPATHYSEGCARHVTHTLRFFAFFLPQKTEAKLNLAPISQSRRRSRLSPSAGHPLHHGRIYLSRVALASFVVYSPRSPRQLLSLPTHATHQWYPQTLSATR